MTAEAVNMFLQSRRAKGLSPQTIRWYRGILLLFAKKFPKVPKSPSDIEQFLLECRCGDERRHGYYRALRCFYQFLHKRGGTPLVMEYVEPPHRSHKEPYWLIPDELNRLLSYPHPPGIKTALLFLTDTGARLGELSSLSIDNIRETPWGYIVGIKGKTGVRYVPISYETYHALMVSLPLGKGKHRLGRLISIAFKNAGVKGSAIALRHTFGTLWEGDELALQAIMGHAHLSTTKIYRHLRMKTLSEQHRLYSPLRMVLYSSKEMDMI
jgi:integrase